MEGRWLSTVLMRAERKADSFTIRGFNWSFPGRVSGWLDTMMPTIVDKGMRL